MVEKVNMSQQNTPKEPGVVAAKPAEQTQPASNNNDHAQATTPKVASTDKTSADATRAKRLKKFIPVLVLYWLPAFCSELWVVGIAS